MKKSSLRNVSFWVILQVDLQYKYTLSNIAMLLDRLKGTVLTDELKTMFNTRKQTRWDNLKPSLSIYSFTP